jgi:hypothetical protein
MNVGVIVSKPNEDKMFISKMWVETAVRRYLLSETEM